MKTILTVFALLITIMLIISSMPALAGDEADSNLRALLLKKLDKNNNGVIDDDEWKIVDQDRDGKISLEEFKRIWPEDYEKDPAEHFQVMDIINDDNLTKGESIAPGIEVPMIKW